MSSIYYFPIPLEFCSPVWSIICDATVLLGGLLGEGPAVLILKCLCLAEFHHPLPGDQTQCKLFAVCGFCFLKAFLAFLGVKIKMATPQSPAQELKDGGVYHTLQIAVVTAHSNPPQGKVEGC